MPHYEPDDYPDKQAPRCSVPIPESPHDTDRRDNCPLEPGHDGDCHRHDWRRWDSFGDYGWSCELCGENRDEQPEGVIEADIRARLAALVAEKVALEATDPLRTAVESGMTYSEAVEATDRYALTVVAVHDTTEPPAHAWVQLPDRPWSVALTVELTHVPDGTTGPEQVAREVLGKTFRLES